MRDIFVGQNPRTYWSTYIGSLHASSSQMFLVVTNMLLGVLVASYLRSVSQLKDQFLGADIWWTDNVKPSGNHIVRPRGFMVSQTWGKDTTTRRGPSHV